MHEMRIRVGRHLGVAALYVLAHLGVGACSSSEGDEGDVEASEDGSSDDSSDKAEANDSKDDSSGDQTASEDAGDAGKNNATAEAAPAAEGNPTDEDLKAIMAEG